MRISVRRLAMAVLFWLLVIWICMAAIPAAAQPMETVAPEGVHIRSAKGKRENGIVSVTAEFTIEVTCRSGDLLWVTVSCGTQSMAYPLGENEPEKIHCVTLSGCIDPNILTVTVSGYRRSGSDGENSLQPVQAEAAAAVDGERILTLQLPEKKNFRLYRVGQLWQLLNGYLTLNEYPTEEERRLYGVRENLVALLAGDENGIARFNFTENGCSDGVYLLMEEGSGEGRYITIPAVDAHGELISSHVRITLEE